MNALDLAVIHDAKNTLSGLLLRLEKHGHLEKEMEMLMRTSTRLTNLLLWHKQEAGEMHLNIDAASPREMVDELLSEYSHTFPEIRLHLLAEELPAYWFYDESYLRLALSNALHNACHFARKKVDLTVGVDQDMLFFSIKDDGPGFSTELLDAYIQQNTIETTHRGTGLGLMLARRIAELHKNRGISGRVTLKNQHGALFQIFLP